MDFNVPFNNIRQSDIIPVLAGFSGNGVGVWDTEKNKTTSITLLFNILTLKYFIYDHIGKLGVFYSTIKNGGCYLPCFLPE